jgi:ribonuclease HI
MESNRQVFYVVRKGRQPGIFSTWEEIHPLVDRYPGASYKKFNSKQEAEKFLKGEDNLGKQKQTKMSQYILINVPENKEKLQQQVQKQEEPSIKKKPLITVKNLVMIDQKPKTNLFKAQENNLIQTKITAEDQIKIDTLENNLDVVTSNQFKQFDLSDSLKETKSNQIKTDALENNLDVVTSNQFKQFDLLDSLKETKSNQIKDVKQTKKIAVYCDGSTIDNGKKNASGGIGIFFTQNDPKNVSEPFLLEIPTNQRTELYAFLRALKIINQMIDCDRENNYEFDLYTDSRYTINCVTKWITGWAKNNWIKANGQPVQNLSLIQQLSKEYNQHRRQIRIHHVRSHTRLNDPHSIGNEFADQLAKNGTSKHPNYRQSKQQVKKFSYSQLNKVKKIN